MNLDGRKMRAVQTAPNGKIGWETIFHFSQTGNVVEAHYAGGRITTGYLTGILHKTALSFRYCQISDLSEIEGGASLCHLEQTQDGRVRVIESFAWESQSGGGVNIIEEFGD